MFIFTIFGCVAEDSQSLTSINNDTVTESTTSFTPVKWRLGFGTSMDGDVEPCG